MKVTIIILSVLLTAAIAAIICLIAKADIQKYINNKTISDWTEFVAACHTNEHFEELLNKRIELYNILDKTYSQNLFVRLYRIKSSF